ncbi:MAG: AbrB/MazE/SpoVT family DNA-binding domain-containing protein [Clostridium lundense]|nr:AbrB/MazE/SpoVT family DNA-binding domain-containing protein [Clostridium lundense]
MKATGIVRKVDSLGRVVIPREITKTHNIKLNETSLEIYVDGDQIILKKYQPSCIFCHEAKVIVEFKGKNVCKKCIKELKK